MKHNICPRQTENIKSYHILDEMVLYSPKNEKAFSLNPSAKAIWNLCDGKQSITDIVCELTLIFDGDEAKLESDVVATVEQFYDLGLVELLEE